MNRVQMRIRRLKRARKWRLSIWPRRIKKRSVRMTIGTNFRRSHNRPSMRSPLINSQLNLTSRLYQHWLRHWTYIYYYSHPDQTLSCGVDEEWWIEIIHYECMARNSGHLQECRSVHQKDAVSQSAVEEGHPAIHEYVPIISLFIRGVHHIEVAIVCRLPNSPAILFVVAFQDSTLTGSLHLPEDHRS